MSKKNLVYESDKSNNNEVSFLCLTGQAIKIPVNTDQLVGCGDGDDPVTDVDPTK